MRFAQVFEGLTAGNAKIAEVKSSILIIKSSCSFFSSWWVLWIFPAAVPACG